MVWVSPTGYNDPDSRWSDEPKAYDGNTGTWALTNLYEAGWGKFLELTLTDPILSDKLRYHVWKAGEYVTQIDVDVYNYTTSSWVDVYSGAFASDTWIEKTYTKITASKIRIRFYCAEEATFHYGYINEAEVWQIEGVAYDVTITESLGMLDSTTKIHGAKQTITEKLGMLDSQVPKWDAHLTVSDKIGMLDTSPTKGYYKQVVSDMVGIVDSVTRKGYFKQIITDILGLLDTTSNKGTFKQTVTEKLGMLDSVIRSRGFPITITDIIGMRDKLITKKRRFPLPDLPDHTIRGGAPP